ncbi:MAG TPA: hypothetical protein PLJ27_18120, partial [Polyangiaceae bacterium]|nr:hypothetical protein [Polyangiaceae bacterium]
GGGGGEWQAMSVDRESKTQWVGFMGSMLSPSGGAWLFALIESACFSRLDGRGSGLGVSLGKPMGSGSW